MTPQNWADCPQCGSAFFHQEDYRQYTGSASELPSGGLTPGNDYRQVKVCLCGEPMPLGVLARIDEVGKSLQESLAMARKYREGRDKGKILVEFQALNE